MDGAAWLEEVGSLYRRYKSHCERAAAQVSDEDFFLPVGRSPHSIAVLTKHLGGNHRSRWRDFLTTDGEKRDRDRESEFIAEGETRAAIEARWEEGWAIAFESLAGLEPADLDRTVTIRGEPLSVMQAIHRNLNHVVYHTGQIVQLARHFTGDAWQTLSIAPGKSEEHNAAMRAKYGDWWAREADPSAGPRAADPEAATVQPSTSNAPRTRGSRSTCGVVVYDVRAGELHGRWTVNLPAYEGKTGTERATGGRPGVLEGEYDVEIFDPAGDSIYRGTLYITKVGDGYHLQWRGDQGDYDGLGLTAAGSELAATYWQV